MIPNSITLNETDYLTRLPLLKQIYRTIKKLILLTRWMKNVLIFFKLQIFMATFHNSKIVVEFITFILGSYTNVKRILSDMNNLRTENTPD